MVKFGFVRAQADFDVAQALAKRQLRERHAQKLIEVRKSLGWITRRVSGYAAAKRVERQKVHELGEDQFAGEHRETPGRKNPSFSNPRSSR
jgi:hypothetical protein